VIIVETIALSMGRDGRPAVAGGGIGLDHPGESPDAAVEDLGGRGQRSRAAV
jgi:hypothetical protein